MAKIQVQPSADEARSILLEGIQKKPQTDKIYLLPLCASFSGEFHTPSSLYMKVAAGSEKSFLLETATTSKTVGRYSLIGANPRKTLVSGPCHDYEGDPLVPLSRELLQYCIVDIPSLRLPPLTGGAFGYVGYDCIKYFEPAAKRELVDTLRVPESLFMLFDTIIAMDHFFQKVTVITYIQIDLDLVKDPVFLEKYALAQSTITRMVGMLKGTSNTPRPIQGPIALDNEWSSNTGRQGYEGFVTSLKKHIVSGDIIQAVPSQRIARPTKVHPFNIYRTLRKINPSPYLFYFDCTDFQIIGASPEVLVKNDPASGRIITHPIAGTVKCGASPLEDEELAEQLRKSAKDRAEHLMLVDLARNDVNRVCNPDSTRVDKLMEVQRFSHVQHLVSEVSGVLRADKTRFDAFRSIFPAGTVSGAPKIRAMQLISEMEREKRGIYAGAVGYFGYDTMQWQSIEARWTHREGAMDLCIALRTMMMMDGTVYVQVGGGIVSDSDEGDEYEETINKAAANMFCIDQAERTDWDDEK